MKKFKNCFCIFILKYKKREDVRRDLAERKKFVPPDLRAGEHVFYWQEDPSKIEQGRKSGKWLKVEINAVKGSMAVVNTGATIFQTNISKLKRQLYTMDLEEQERLCCGSLVKVKLMSEKCCRTTLV